MLTSALFPALMAVAMFYSARRWWPAIFTRSACLWLGFTYVAFCLADAAGIHIALWVGWALSAIDLALVAVAFFLDETGSRSRLHIATRSLISRFHSNNRSADA